MPRGSAHESKAWKRAPSSSKQSKPAAFKDRISGKTVGLVGYHVGF